MHTIARVSAKIFLIVFLLTGICAISDAQSPPAPPANQLVLESKAYSIRFEWQGDSNNAQWEPHSALLLPVKFPSCSEQFYMQFDLGAPYSMFYRHEIEKIRSKYPKAVQKADSSSVVRNCTFKVGDMPVNAKEIVVKETGSAMDAGEKKIRIIGTIGADFIVGRVILIDYPNQKIFTGIELPSKLKLDRPLTNFVFAGRSILFPAVIGGKNTMLFFDTGSSAFQFITDKETASSLAIPGAVPTQYPVKSWNRILTAYTLSANGNITIGTHTIPLNKVSYVTGASSEQIDRMMKMGMGGMIGNKLFINFILLLDMRNNKFGLVEGF